MLQLFRCLIQKENSQGSQFPWMIHKWSLSNITPALNERIIVLRYTFKLVAQLWWKCKTRAVPSQTGQADINDNWHNRPSLNTTKNNCVYVTLHSLTMKPHNQWTTHEHPIVCVIYSILSGFSEHCVSSLTTGLHLPVEDIFTEGILL